MKSNLLGARKLLPFDFSEGVVIDEISNVNFKILQV